ncbi:MAG: hypothetical protein F6K62_16425 [Sphaerospermopsis sp. SIO1G2]|nr:hypothetical protein [Sphaerospermopsis sp. SIO1G2]
MTIKRFVKKRSESKWDIVERQPDGSTKKVGQSDQKDKAQRSANYANEYIAEKGKNA